MSASSRDYDLVCMGRACVDLYGEQFGSPLEDVDSFRKYVGGGSANIAVGTARLGLRVAMLTRVGDEQLGRFLVSAMQREGIDTQAVVADPQRLTPMVLLAVRALDGFPRVFHYADPADLAVAEGDVDPELLANSQAVLIGGACLSRPVPRAAARKAIDTARHAGTTVVLDLDYRPVLWELVGHAHGAQMTGQATEVTARYAEVLADCDVIVGTEEELAIAGGAPDIDTALRAIRSQSDALIIRKTGARGAIVYDAAIPANPDDGLRGPGFEVEVLNTVGAGDAFLSGFLRGWLRGEGLEDSLRLANACGAIVVTRHGCSPAMPTEDELTYFLDRSAQRTSVGEDPSKDPWLAHLHHATTRGRVPSPMVLAVDHRWQLEQMADAEGAPRSRIAGLKELFVDAFLEVAADCPHAGILIDDHYGGRALERVTGTGAWIARSVEVAGSRPVEFVGGDNVALELRTWPREHIAKVMVYCDPQDDDEMWRRQGRRLRQLSEVCAAQGRQVLVELQTPDGSGFPDGTVAPILERIYRLPVRPDWWKLPPGNRTTDWRAIGDVVRAHDPYCLGILLLGQAQTPDVLSASFEAARAEPLCRGFAVGRSIFAEPAAGWLRGELDDEKVAAAVAANYRATVAQWTSA